MKDFLLKSLAGIVVVLIVLVLILIVGLGIAFSIVAFRDGNYLQGAAMISLLIIVAGISLGTNLD